MNDFIVTDVNGTILANGQSNVRLEKDDVLQLPTGLYTIIKIAVTINAGHGRWTFTYVVEHK
jgi:uncharacterized UPF0146 family protein